MGGVVESSDEPILSGRARRLRLAVNGIVQGVGFRPYVYRLATSLGLSGSIRNTASGVLIEVQAETPLLLERFVQELGSEAPPLAEIFSVVADEIPAQSGTGFVILSSDDGEDVETLIPPDIALCDDCRSELLDPLDRRYRYAFINCTNCGPRFSIVERLPYDRPLTSMKGFTMCEKCGREYGNPLDRRFHAQPNACPDCGPALQLLDAGGEPINTPDPLSLALRKLKDGHIVAVKGVGGFHLAVDATDQSAVMNLRERKGRERKPFAVMARTVRSAEKVAQVSDEERAALRSLQAPVVLMHKNASVSLLAPDVAPANDRIGIMLPYTPLHVLMMEEGPEFLVMTSANSSEEPIALENDEAVSRLQGIADYFLVHNRPIHLRCDDSVTMVMSGSLRQIRRSRGYAPLPVLLSSDGPSVLAVGGEMKNTVCVLHGSQALLSQHIGDLKNYVAYEHFQQVAEHMQHIFQVRPEAVICDMHPSYLSTQWAQNQSDIPVLHVQHHHAHLVSCLAENRFDGQAVGIILDGTGYGTDGTIWGGEVLIGDASGFFRFASLEPVRMPGGDSAALYPWKAAAGYLFHTFGHIPEIAAFEGCFAEGVADLLARQVNAPPASSCGRLFDAVAALCGLCREISYEGQAAIELMHAAGIAEGKPFAWEVVPAGSDRWYLSVAPMIQDIMTALGSAMSVLDISRRFHVTIVKMFSDIALRACRFSGLTSVALSGGVFQNPLVFEGLVNDLQLHGIEVLTHSQVPSNDGGLSLGQAVIGRQWVKTGCACRRSDA